MARLIHLSSGLDVVMERESTGGYVAVVPALPGCASQGDSYGETLQNVDDAIGAVLSILAADDPARLQQLRDSVTLTGGE